MEHAVPVSLQILYRRLLAALCFIPSSPGSRATPQNNQNDTGEVVAKQVPQKVTRQDEMQQPKAAEDWGRIVCPELGQVQLSRAKENWGRVVRPKLSQSPTKRETAAQGVPGGACEPKHSRTTQERHSNVRSTTDGPPGGDPLPTKSQPRRPTPVVPAPQHEAVADASKDSVGRLASSEPKTAPSADMEGWEDVDSDFEEFGYSRSATKAVPSCGGSQT